MRGAGHDLTPCPKGPASSCDPSPARGLLEDRLGGICRRSTFRRRTCRVHRLVAGEASATEGRAPPIRATQTGCFARAGLDANRSGRAPPIRAAQTGSKKRGHPALPIGTGGVAKKRLTEQEWVAPEQAGTWETANGAPGLFLRVSGSGRPSSPRHRTLNLPGAKQMAKPGFWHNGLNGISRSGCDVYSLWAMYGGTKDANADRPRPAFQPGRRH